MEQLDTLLSLDVNKMTEKKSGLTYLSWANAWIEFLKVYPEATYTIKKDESGVPAFGNDKMGYVCYTEVTAGDITREMWLPVMNGANKAMKTVPYKYNTKYGDKDVEAMSMFDVNKTVMRCLTKNLAMFGLGLYIYAGEDLPTEQEPNYRNEIWNLIHADKVPEADREKYIADFKANPVMLNADTVAQIKAKYFNA